MLYRDKSCVVFFVMAVWTQSLNNEQATCANATLEEQMYPMMQCMQWMRDVYASPKQTS